MTDHPHAAIARRLKRANGHLEKIIAMIEQEKPCSQIAQQLQAVESAIESAKKALILTSATASRGRSMRPAREVMPRFGTSS